MRYEILLDTQVFLFYALIDLAYTRGQQVMKLYRGISRYRCIIWIVLHVSINLVSRIFFPNNIFISRELMNKIKKILILTYIH